MASSGFRECTLGDIAEFRNGKALSSDLYLPFGRHPVFGSNGLIARTNEVLTQEPLVVIGRVGAYCGSVHHVNESAWITDNAIIATGKDKTDVRFLFYLLGSLELRRTAIGSAQPLMTQGGLKVVPALVPPLPEQKAIAHILGTLDDKIELNRRMNATLEAMARALFQSWFVDFDPVRAKLDGRLPAGLDDTTAALFPAHFQDSPLGPIPQGWEVKTVGEIGNVVCGKTPSTSVSEYYGEDIPFITIPDMHGNVFVVSTGRKLSHAGVSSQANKTLPPGSICVSCIATPGLVVITSENSQTNQQINSVIPYENDETYFWYWVMKGLGAEISASGSGGSVLINLSKGRFETLQVIKPDPKLIKTYYSVARPLFEMILENTHQSRTLATLRDTLLPKLLSGELSVGKAEALRQGAK